MSNKPSAVASHILGLVLLLALAAPLGAAQEERWQVVGKVGQVNIDDRFGPADVAWKIDDDDTAGSVAVGWAVNRYLVLQGGYHDLGSHLGRARTEPCPPTEHCPLSLVAEEPASVDFTGYSLAVVPRWPVSERFWVHGKVGLFDWRGEVSDVGTQPLIGTPSDTELLAGVGAEYRFARGLGLLVEAEDSGLSRSLSAGASWRF